MCVTRPLNLTNISSSVLYDKSIVYKLKCPTECPLTWVQAESLLQLKFLVPLLEMPSSSHAWQLGSKPSHSDSPSNIIAYVVKKTSYLLVYCRSIYPEGKACFLHLSELRVQWQQREHPLHATDVYSIQTFPGLSKRLREPKNLVTYPQNMTNYVVLFLRVMGLNMTNTL